MDKSAVSGQEPTYYTPDPSYRVHSWMGDYTWTYNEFVKDPDKFWDNIAKKLHWFRPYDKVSEWNYPYAKWFVNGKTNITYNCLDRHVLGTRRNKVALIWKGEHQNEERVFTYRQLYRDVQRFANGLKKLGVVKGDRVCIYIPVIPEQIIAMLACTRIGAIHSVVFGGYGAAALNQRIVGAGAKIVITADMAIRRGKAIPLKQIIEEAIINAPTVEHLIILRREQRTPVEIHSEMEIDFYDLMADVDADCPAEIMDSEDPLFILYTSGTTGAPKGIVHTCGGYMVGAYYTTKYIFDIKEHEVYWCTADPGWITGHSYVVYGPLSVGATVLITESTPDYPDPGIWWKIIEEYGVNILYTAPTAIRMFMKLGREWPDKYNLSSLRVLGSVGEPLNPEAFEWFYHVIGKDRCPIVDTWWQTETGMHMVTTVLGEPMRPGYAGKSIPGVVADVVDKDGKTVEPGKRGFLVIRQPWPSMMRTVYNNDERYRRVLGDNSGMLPGRRPCDQG